MNDRHRTLERANRLVSGDRAGITNDTLRQPLLCAQLVRQVTESALGLRPGSWPVAARALALARHRGRGIRWAVDYEDASKELGLSVSEARPGDVLYWPYVVGGIGYGHTAILLEDGLIFENTNADRGRAVFGAGGPVRVTPFASVPVPRTVAAVSLNARPAVEQGIARPPVADGELVDVVSVSTNLVLGPGTLITRANGGRKKVYVKLEQLQV